MTNKLFATSFTVLMLTTFAWADESDGRGGGQGDERPAPTRNGRERDNSDREPELRPPEISAPMRRGREQRGFGNDRPDETAMPNLREHQERLDKLKQQLIQLRNQQGSREQRERAERAIAESAEHIAEMTKRNRGPHRPEHEQARPWSPEHARDGKPNRDRNLARDFEHNRGRWEIDQQGETEFREHIERRIEEMLEHSLHERERREPEVAQDRERRHTAERIDHLHRAAEHLRHAGQGELAEQVMERVGDMERSLQQQEREHVDRDRDQPSRELRELHGRMNALQRAVDELSEQVHQLRRERD